MSVSVSIIIPVFNASRYLDECIRHIRQQNDESARVDIFVVDNGSTDDSVAILQRNQLRFCIEPDLNISGLRNVGVNNTAGEIVAFVDSDCFVDQNWLGVAVQELCSDPTIGIVGSYYGLPDNPTWVEKTWCALKAEAVGDVKFLSSGNMLMKRSLFEQVGGFSETIVTGEDYDLCQKVRQAGYRIINNPNIKTTHMGNVKKLNDIIRKERWYGAGMMATLRNGEVSRPLLLSVLFLGLLLSALIFMFTSFELFTAAVVALVLLPVFAAFYLTRKVTANRGSVFVKCIPVAACYVIGRSLAVIDMIRTKLFDSIRT